MTTADVGSTLASDCACLGNYKRKTGTRTCIRCGLGERFDVNTDDDTEGTCEECVAGYYQDNSDHLSPTCVLCPADTYRVEPGGTNLAGCLACRAGAESDAGSTSTANCTCTAAYITETDSGNCIQCEAGEVFVPTSDGSSEGTCDDCGSGRYQDADQPHMLTQCTACPIGKYRADQKGALLLRAQHELVCDPLLCLQITPNCISERPGSVGAQAFLWQIAIIAPTTAQ